MQKTAGENTEYSRNETFFNIYFLKVYSPCKWQFGLEFFQEKVQDFLEKGQDWVKIFLENAPFSKVYSPCKMGSLGGNFFSKNMPKMIIQEQYSCSVQKNPWTNMEYSRNATILKIGHFAKFIAHAKWAV